MVQRQHIMMNLEIVLYIIVLMLPRNLFFQFFGLTMEPARLIFSLDLTPQKNLRTNEKGS